MEEKSVQESNQTWHHLKTINWTKKFAFYLGFTAMGTLISFPILAQFYPPYSLFQPLAYPGSPYRSFKSNIIDTLSKDSQFDNLVAQLDKAGLTQTLKEGKFTILAPTDEAFAALPNEILNKLIQPENRLKVLKYHLIAGEVSKENIYKGEVKTLEGNAIAISNLDGKFKINNANAKHPSTITNNGIIIEIDEVLLPPDF